MAKSMASKKRSLPVDYTQLHSLSSVVLYDTSFKKSRGKLYDVERIIERRKTRYVSFFFILFISRTFEGPFRQNRSYMGFFCWSSTGLFCRSYTGLFSCFRRVYFIGRLQWVFFFLPQTGLFCRSYTCLFFLVLQGFI